jgi:hypothetical protein
MPLLLEEDKMARCDNKILDELLEIVNGYHGSDYHVMGEIPQRKLSASTSFHGVDPRDTVLVLLDSTVMGSAENGISITLKGIYWKNMWAVKTRKNSYTWEELSKLINQIEIQGDNIVFERGVELYVPANYSEISLLNLIKALTNFFIESTQGYEDTNQLSSNKNEEINQNILALPSGRDIDDYCTTLINSLVLCVYHSGTTDEQCLELALEFLNQDDSIIVPTAIDRMSTIIQQIESDYKKSPVFFKLKQSKLIAECKPILAHEIEQLSIMVDAIQEVTNSEGKNKIPELWAKILNRIS